VRTFDFSQQDLEAIGHERYYHPHPRVQQKMEVLRLKHLGYTHTAIATAAGVSRRTVQRYLDAYLAGGLDGVRRLAWKGTSSALTEHSDRLEEYFLEHPPRSTAEAQAAIERLTGVRRGLTQVRGFLKKVSACAGAR
jgi:transposase